MWQNNSIYFKLGLDIAQNELGALSIKNFKVLKMVIFCDQRKLSNFGQYSPIQSLCYHLSDVGYQ